MDVSTRKNGESQPGADHAGQTHHYDQIGRGRDHAGQRRRAGAGAIRHAVQTRKTATDKALLTGETTPA